MSIIVVKTNNLQWVKTITVQILVRQGLRKQQKITITNRIQWLKAVGVGDFSSEYTQHSLALLNMIKYCLKVWW